MINIPRDGLTDLARLLAEMSPYIHDKIFVFTTLGDGQNSPLADLQPYATCREPEGLSLILEQAEADRQGLNYEGTFRMISLQVHSSLHAVGLTAAVSTALADRGIAANMVAGRYHDHVLVPAERAAEAMTILEDLG
ncbi:MAG: ACT domain-containing protein [Xanthomonadales bacterium]|nr:ACT domain-containing protein [Xanthomonadales bacterium]